MSRRHREIDQEAKIISRANVKRSLKFFIPINWTRLAIRSFVLLAATLVNDPLPDATCGNFHFPSAERIPSAFR